MKKAIVVGGAGFVGSAVVIELLARSIDVTVIVRPGFDPTKNQRLNNLRVNIIECDIANILEVPKLLPERDFDVWYQFAWDGLFNEPLMDYTVQTNNIKYVMDAVVVARALGCKKFVGAGSITQYELRTLEGQTNINDKHRVYKTAKLACEYMGRSVASREEIEFYWPIITNIFGEGEESPRLINSMIKKLLAGDHQKLSEGNQIYDFIYISDAARAFADIGQCGMEHRTYVIGSGGAKPLKEFLSELRDIVAPEAELGFGDLTYSGVYLQADDYSINALREDTGFEPQVPFADGVRRTMNWIVNRNIL